MIIPAYDLDKSKQEIFNFVLDRILATKLSRIIVVGYGLHRIKHDPRISVIKENPTDVINRAKLINKAVLMSNTEFVWINDPDVFLSFDKVLEIINEKIFVVCKPLSRMFKLDASETKSFMSNRSLDVGDQIQDNLLCRGSMIFRRDAYLSVRGYDERINEHEYQDAELAIRISTLFSILTLDTDGLRLSDKATLRDNYPPVDPYVDMLCKDSHDKTLNYGEMLSHIESVESQIPYHWKKSVLKDTAVIIAAYGNKEQRKRTNCLALKELMRSQIQMPTVYLYEVVYDGDVVYEDFCKEYGIRWRGFNGGEKNKDLFQKEALYNLAIKERKEEHLIFFDADAYPLSPTWASDIVDILKEDKNAVIQPYSVFNDKLAGKVASSHSYAIYCEPDVKRDYWRGEYRQPGLIWAMNKSFIEQHMFNTFHITGGGDGCFVMEYVDDRSQNHALTRRYFRQLHRGHIKRGNCRCVPSVAMHSYHGPFTNRAYNWSRELFDFFGSIEQYVRIGSNGLMEWIDSHTPLRYCLHNKSRLQTEADTKKVMAEALEWTYSIRNKKGPVL